MKKLLLLFLLIPNLVLGLNLNQTKVKEIANKTALTFCLQDLCFDKVLQAIAWQESSFGEKIRNGKEPSLGTFQIRLKTAKYIIKKRKLEEYNYLLNDDKQIEKLLLTDAKFSSIIAVNYLILNYKLAKFRNYKYPLFYAISKYNGGAKNFNYVKQIVKKMNRL